MRKFRGLTTRRMPPPSSSGNRGTEPWRRAGIYGMAVEFGAYGLSLSLTQRPDAVHVLYVAIEPHGRRWIFADRPERKAQAPFVAEVSAALRQPPPVCN